MRVRRALAVLLFVYGSILITLPLTRGDFPSFSYFVLPMMSAALWVNRGGRFARDWLAVFAGIYAYALAGNFAEKLNFSVHYLPQIDVDRALGLGTLPTVWLQQHLYHGTTGPLEIFTAVMYLSHFLMPLAVAFYLWWTNRRLAFRTLLFGILAVSILGEITFVLAPTAPPWLAAEHGFIPPVHHIIKQALYDMHLGKSAAFYGNPHSYNIVAALPSLHAAWPVVGILVSRRHRLPRWVLSLQLFQFVGVLFAIVYAGEHYVVDALGGAVYALVATALVSRALEERATHTTERARPHPQRFDQLPEVGVAASSSR